jgi:hypothetical protein
MLQSFSSRFIFAAALMWPAIGVAAPAIRLPPGTRAEGDHQVSGRGLRETTDFVTKELDRSGLAIDRIGPYAVHGVEIARFVSRTASTPWLAIHVVRIAGKTLIFFVPRPSS